ncbi:MAG: glycosyltransferase family 39 protein [Deltaproteobacteria bacterium]|nr:glycosyltransferase family 39 protein [Deltaproteobacteria bacterium]
MGASNASASDPSATGDGDGALAPRGCALAPLPLVAVRGREVALVALLAVLIYVPFLGSYSFWDPWETHYGEVARRMQEDHDWVVTRWQNEVFRSKPVLTFWLMSAGMTLFGVGKDGGYSGEFVASSLTEWSIRLPFALFGVLGVVMLWYAIARLYSRRAAWLSALVCATSPYYFMITRQAITDMPACSLLVGGISLFALAVLEEEDRPCSAWWGLSSYRLFLLVFLALVGVQLVHFTAFLSHARMFVAPGRWLPGSLVMIPLAFMTAGVAIWSWLRTTSARQVYMYWFYLFMGLAVLAKGLATPAVAGLTILGYLLLTGQWKLLLKVEIPRGVLVALAVCLPWHFAMYIKDGMPWFNEYVGQHLLGRAFSGVHGDRGTFNYFFGQLGIGMWPWVALAPAALAHLAVAGRPQAREQKLRLIFGIWAVAAFFFFAIVKTKFHHYILPAVPALAVLVGLWLHDLLGRRVAGATTALVVSLGLFLVTSIDVVSAQEKLVHLYIYRYDRPWPGGPPWSIDFTLQLLAFALLIGVAIAALMFSRARRAATCGLALCAVAFTVFTIDVLLTAASPHWGQRTLHEVYYKNRQIHGVDLAYSGLREVAQDWASGNDLAVPCFVPKTLNVGDAMRVTYDALGEKGELMGQVSRIGVNKFWIAVSQDERAKLATLLERARTSGHAPSRRWLSVNADRLIAWQLNWRGENFYSGGEIYNHRVEDARTVYMDTDNKAFLEYLNAPARTGKGRKFWVITEKARLAGLRSVLPTPKARESLREEDNSSNKFALGSFTLD